MVEPGAVPAEVEPGAVPAAGVPVGEVEGVLEEPEEPAAGLAEAAVEQAVAVLAAVQEVGVAEQEVEEPAPVERAAGQPVVVRAVWEAVVSARPIASGTIP